MSDQNTDTIAAIATPPGRGGVGIIRVSGPLAKTIAEKVLGKLPQPRFADYLPFIGDDNDVIDSGLALYFVGPNSFTGEDVLELQGHGGPVVMDLLLRRVVSLGARIAEPQAQNKLQNLQLTHSKVSFHTGLTRRWKHLLT